MDTFTKVRFPNMETYDEIKNFEWSDFSLDKKIGDSYFGTYGDIYVEVIKDRPNPKDYLTEKHYVEILDRLNVFASMCSDHLLQHPVCKVDKQVTQEVEKAMDALTMAYQIAGNRK